VRIKETGTSIAMSVDGNGRYCALSPREGARLLVAECCRNLSAVGATPVAATNNLNFGNPERPEIMAQLVEAIEGISEACKHFETPITGGNVSLYNETLGEAIWPTPVMGIVGLLKTAPPVTICFKEEGRTVMLLGGLGTVDATRFGGTQYAKVVLNKMWGLPPALDMDYEKRVHSAVREVIAQGLAESSHDVGDGGLAVALAESCAENVGVSITVDTGLRPEFALFHEGPSRILLSTSAPGAIEKIARENNVECIRLGVTMKERLQISNSSETWIDCRVDSLREVWENALENLLSPIPVG
jgi:phosphoribosylformylglycinamidine (FGAM) synthase-like enzyme